MATDAVIDDAPFARSRKSADDFCHGLYLAYVIDECVRSVARLEGEYEAAALQEDAELMRKKRLQIQTYQSSLMLTAYMLDEVDEIST